METTHTQIDGHYVQIVSPRRLREILDEAGDNYERPGYFTDDDEWNVDPTMTE